MNVVENQQRAGLQVGIEIVVFEIWKRVAVGAVDKNQLEFLREAVLRQRDLSGALHESDHFLA